MELLFKMMEFWCSPQISSILKDVVFASFLAIWFARNYVCFQVSFDPIHMSILFVAHLVKESNGLQTKAINNSVENLVLLYKLGVARLLRKAPQILPVHWMLPNAD